MQAFKRHIHHTRKSKEWQKPHTGIITQKNLTCEERARISVNKITKSPSSKSGGSAQNIKRKTKQNKDLTKVNKVDHPHT